MFEIERIEAKNFVLYENLSIDFSSFEGNLVFITGNNLDVSGTDSNCSGKSLIGDLITDILFDKTIRRHSQSSFIGKFGKGCYGEIVIRDTISNKRYWIKKYRNHPSLGDSLRFLVASASGSQDLSKKRKADTYKEIWKTFNINWNTFKNRNYFGQDDPDRFLRVTDAKKADIIVDIQDLSDLQKAKKVSHENVKKSVEEISSLDLKINNVKDQIKFLKSHIKDEKSKSEKKKKDLDSFLDKNKKEIMSLKNQLAKVSSEFSLSEYNEIKSNIENFSDLKDDFNGLLGDKGENERKLSVLKNKKQNETKRKDELIAKILQIENEISDLKKRLIIVCSKCGSKLNKESTKKSIHSLEKTIEGRAEELKKTEEKISEIIEKEESLKSSLKSLGLKIEKIKPKINKFDELESKYIFLKEKKAKKKILSETIKDLVKHSKNISSEIKLLIRNEATSSLEKSLLKSETWLNELESEIKKSRGNKEKNEFSKSVFDKTIRNLFNDFLDNLNVYCNQFLDVLCDNDINVSFSPVAHRKSKKVVDEIRVLVSVDGGESRDFRTYSGGEKGRIDLVTQLALFSSADSTFPFLFLDEPFIGSDKTGRDRMIHLLQEISEKGNKVFVISNKNVPTGYGEKLEVVRKNGKAEIHNG